MKKILLAAVWITITTTSLSINAQQSSNLIIFSEDLQPFFAYVNGIMQNGEAMTNVKITGLTNPSNSVRIVFKDDNLEDISKNMYFQEMGVEATAKIVNTKKGLKLRYFGEVPIASAPASAATEIVYHTEPLVTTSASSTSGTSSSSTSVTVQETTTTTTTTDDVDMNVNMGVGGTTTTTDVQVTETTGGENVSIDMSVGGIGMDVNVNVNDGMGGTTSSTTTTTTTTTTTSGNWDPDVSTDTDVAVTETPSTVYVEGYTGRLGCYYPVSDISPMKEAMENEAFSDSKLATGKQAVKGKCFTVSQVKELAQLFDFSEGKLEFAKFAYDYTYDIDNYYQMNSIFDFDDDKKKLNDYISTK